MNILIKFINCKAFHKNKALNATVNHLFITLSNQILTAKKIKPSADTSALERQIDQMVYKLYGLTDDEIAIVERKG